MSAPQLPVNRGVQVRIFAFVVVLLGALIGPLVTVGTAHAVTNSLPLPIVEVTNATNVPDEPGVFWRSGPKWDTVQAVAGSALQNGNKLQLKCFEHGGPVPPHFSNELWYKAVVVEGSVHKATGMVNDYFLVTPTAKPQDPMPGVPPCSVTPLDDVPISAFRGLDPGTGFGFFTWGSCTVQDFRYGKNGDLVVSRGAAPGEFFVLGGPALAGWHANGGATGPLGCPISPMLKSPDGTEQFVDFNGGKLWWRKADKVALRL
ncbi:hypothetical protein JNJ66_03255 [Candidatus Saccharibacteria bacterium]|nr:hypothetical protein [Candidatus Saccharibacteria bacterium]